ncbi:LysE family translocator [Dictyobacter formicarum]|nr:LysE family translocator [Dictyobacter formicarum]
MLPLSILPLFLAASWTINIAPGPDMLYVLTRSAGMGRLAGIVSALGIAVGCLIQTGIVALGLASLLTAVPLVYDFIKYAGAAYLIYLGLRTLLTSRHTLITPTVKPASLWRIFLQGVITNVLNPKVALFFLAFLPQFTDPARGPIPLQLILLGTLFNISGTLINSVVALLASTFGSWLKRNARATTLLNWLSGGIFIGLGVRLALLKRQ